MTEDTPIVDLPIPANFAGNSPNLCANAIAQLCNGTKETADMVLSMSQKDRVLSNQQIEEMLSQQAILLNTSFFLHMGKTSLRGEASAQSETHRQFALKSQDASRKTLSTLHEIRNPKKPAKFIKNAIQHQTNQLLALGESHAAPMDGITEGEAARAYTELEPMETLDGCDNTRRKAKSKPQCP